MSRLVEITDENKIVAQKLMDEWRSTVYAFRLAGHQAQEANENLFRFIRKIVPDFEQFEIGMFEEGGRMFAYRIDKPEK